MPLPVGMAELNYFQLINRAVDLYREGDPEAAYDLVTEHGDRVGGNPAQIYNFRYCIASALGKKELALQLLREAIDERGYWYSYEYLYDDDDLEPLWEDEEFIRLAEICKEREARAIAEAGPELKLIVPDGNRKGTIIALHGDGENVAIIEGFWSPCVDHGYALALPQSSQITYWNAFVWDELEKARVELVANIEEARGSYGDDVILAGFSSGTRVVLNSLLQGDVRPKAMVLVGPWLPEVEEWAEAIRSLEDVRFFIICGDRDRDCYDKAVRLNEILVEAGVPSKLDIIEGLDHEFPMDFERRLSRIFDEMEKG